MNFSNKIYTEKYVDKIKSNKFQQSNNINDKENILNNKINHKTCNHLFDCILESNDHESLMEDREIYISKKKMKIATDLDEQSEKTYDCYNYNKFFKKKLIQKNMQLINYLSSVLYICDYFKINIIIHDVKKDKYIYLCDKYTNNQIYIFDNGWSKLKNIKDDISMVSLYDIDINDYLIDDLNGKYNIYNTGLKSISNYKSSELLELALKNNLSIKNENGKNKIKKQLYQELCKISNLILP